MPTGMSRRIRSCVMDPGHRTHPGKLLGKGGSCACTAAAFCIWCAGFVGKQPVRLHFLKYKCFLELQQNVKLLAASFEIQRWEKALVIPSLPPSQPPNTASFCFPIFIQEEMLTARLCFSGKRSPSVAEALTQPWRHGQHQHILASAKCVGDKIHLKPRGKTSSDPAGLWLRALTGLYLSPKCSLYFLQVFSCLCSPGEEFLQTQGVCPRVCTGEQRSKTQSELETAGNSAQRQRKN